MSKLVVLLVMITGVFAAPGPELCYYRFEGSGYGTFESMGENIAVTSFLSFGSKPIRSLLTELSLGVTFRNFSVKYTPSLALQYCVPINNEEVRIGIFGGMQTLHIGRFSTNTSFGGIDATFVYAISEHCTLQCKYQSRLFFKQGNRVYGAMVLIGVGYRFGAVQ